MKITRCFYPWQRVIKCGVFTMQRVKRISYI